EQGTMSHFLSPIRVYWLRGCFWATIWMRSGSAVAGIGPAMKRSDDPDGARLSQQTRLTGRDSRRGSAISYAACGLAALLSSATAACASVQSAWAPEAPHAPAIFTLGNGLLTGAGLILALVLGLTALAIPAPHGRRRWLARQKTVF